MSSLKGKPQTQTHTMTNIDTDTIYALIDEVESKLSDFSNALDTLQEEMENHHWDHKWGLRTEPERPGPTAYRILVERLQNGAVDGYVSMGAVTDFWMEDLRSKVADLAAAEDVNEVLERSQDFIKEQQEQISLFSTRYEDELIPLIRENMEKEKMCCNLESALEDVQDTLDELISAYYDLTGPMAHA